MDVFFEHASSMHMSGVEMSDVETSSKEMSGVEMSLVTVCSMKGSDMGMSPQSSSSAVPFLLLVFGCCFFLLYSV